ncbi:MAG: hypothetical protein A2Y57_02605, partial [Candidatus Woykebacteria bacterium RBG_13_40_7b]
MVESTNLEKLIQEYPFLTAKYAPQFSSEDFEKIGIKIPEAGLEDGYIKLYPEDFIVEEVNPKGKICTIEKPQEKPTLQEGENQRYLNTTLVKKGMATFEAESIIAYFLKIPVRNISHAGIKDAVAITSQRISIKNPTLETVTAIEHSRMFLKDFEFNEPLVTEGGLAGNIFTILVRTKSNFDQAKIEERIEKIREDGFPNFFSLQRFGRRLENHRVGKLIIQRKFEEAVKTVLTESSPYEAPLVTLLRTKVYYAWGDWEKVEELFRKMANYFRDEVTLVRYLKREPKDFRGALASFPNLAKLYVYAYTAYLFNKKLSEIYQENRENPPQLLPLTSPYNPETLQVYGQYLKEENLSLEDFIIRELPFIRINRLRIPTFIKPGLLDYRFLPQGAAFRFILRKGSYATSFLSYIFNLTEGEPKPLWLNKELINTQDKFKEKEMEEIKEESLPQQKEIVEEGAKEE